jgi:hypothetical protein
MFLSETAAPAALKMSLATKQFGGSDRADQSAYAAAFGTDIPLASVFELRPRLQRQFNTYLSFVANDDEASARDVLMRVDWASLGKADVVDVSTWSNYSFPPAHPTPQPARPCFTQIPTPPFRLDSELATQPYRD